jgi:hypothetical protein
LDCIGAALQQVCLTSMLVVLGHVDSTEITQLRTELEDLKAAHVHQVDKLEAREVELQQQLSTVLADLHQAQHNFRQLVFGISFITRSACLLFLDYIYVTIFVPHPQVATLRRSGRALRWL